MKKNVNLGYAERTETLDLLQDKLLAVTGNGVEAASVDDFIAAVGNAEEAMRRIAWGIPLRQTANTHWGTVGNWPLWEEYRRHVGRYLVTPDGEARKLNPSHSGYYLDGSEVDESEGNVMVIAPKLHVRVIDDPLLGCPVVWMSQQPLGGFALANAGGEWNCYAAYKGAMSGGKLVSRSEMAMSIETGTMANHWAAAQQNGSDWGCFDYDGWRWFCLMCLCESCGDSDIQAALGYGLKGNAASNADFSVNVNTGATKALGDATAVVPIADKDEQSCHVSVCGMENLYGLGNEPIQGIYTSTTVPKMAYIYKGNRYPTAAEFASAPNGEYREAQTIASGSLTSRMALGEWLDLVPTVSGGDGTNYWAAGLMTRAQGQVFGVGMGVGNQSANRNSPFAVWMYYPYASKVNAPRLGYYGHLTFA